MPLIDRFTETHTQLRHSVSPFGRNQISKQTKTKMSNYQHNTRSRHHHQQQQQHYHYQAQQEYLKEQHNSADLWTQPNSNNNNNMDLTSTSRTRPFTNEHKSLGAMKTTTASNGCIPPTLDDLPSPVDQVTPEEVICDDLQAFENRLGEIVGYYRPRSIRNRIILCLVMLVTLVTTYGWLLDPATMEMSFFESLIEHKLFTLSCVVLIVLLLNGFHRRVFAHHIIVARIRDVLAQFNMNCDDYGRLILMIQPNYHHNGHR